MNSLRKDCRNVRIREVRIIIRLRETEQGRVACVTELLQAFLKCFKQALLNVLNHKHNHMCKCFKDYSTSTNLIILRVFEAHFLMK